MHESEHPFTVAQYLARFHETNDLRMVIKAALEALRLANRGASVRVLKYASTTLSEAGHQEAVGVISKILAEDTPELSQQRELLKLMLQVAPTRTPAPAPVSHLQCAFCGSRGSPVRGYACQRCARDLSTVAADPPRHYPARGHLCCLCGHERVGDTHYVGCPSGIVCESCWRAALQAWTE